MRYKLILIFSIFCASCSQKAETEISSNDEDSNPVAYLYYDTKSSQQIVYCSIDVDDSTKTNLEIAQAILKNSCTTPGTCPKSIDRYSFFSSLFGLCVPLGGVATARSHGWNINKGPCFSVARNCLPSSFSEKSFYECTNNYECPTATPACVKYVCVKCASKSDCTSNKAPVCNVTTGVCIGCSSNSDCSEQAPICNVSSGECAGCTTNAQCSTYCGPLEIGSCFGPGCGCLTPQCITSAQCKPPKPTCSNYQCVK